MNFIINDEGNAIPCKCRQEKINRERIKKSGLQEGFQEKTFKTYQVINNETKTTKEKASEYVTNFNDIKNTKNNSIMFLGQPGAGKTHIVTAIANELLNQNIEIRYIRYREVIPRLKRNILDEDYYYKELSKYQNTELLIIDDLYKGKVTEADLNIIFELIDYRYFNKKPIIISSEKTEFELLDYDEAIGSRLIEMAKGRIQVFEGNKFNYRMRG